MIKFKKAIKNILFVFMVIVCCLPFFVNNNISLLVNATDMRFQNKVDVEINSYSGCNVQKNNSLIKKGTADFIDGKIYENQIGSQSNEEINLFLKNEGFSYSKSLFMWIFIPDTTIQDLIISAFDSNGNKISWKFRGSSMFSSSNYKNSLYDLIIENSSQITAGWKLLELSVFDTENTLSMIDSISLISIKYSFNNEFNIAEKFSVLTPFIADSKNNKSKILENQSYAVYADKKDLFDNKTNVYLGDKLTINSAKNFFEYVIVGKQNILENSEGFAWNIIIDKPSGVDVKPFYKKIDINFLEVGNYNIDLMLTSNEYPDYALITRDYSFSCEEFQFGYFQKKNNNLLLGHESVLILTFSNDFELDEHTNIEFLIENKETVLVGGYEMKDGKVYLTLKGNKVGNSIVKVKATGIKTGEKTAKEYEIEISTNVIKTSDNSQDKNLVWIIGGIILSGFAIYLLILFVKSRRFGVK